MRRTAIPVIVRQVRRLASRLFRSPTRALWAAVGVAAALVIVVVLASAFADRRGNERREAVAGYVEDVNRVQAGLALELYDLNRAYGRFRLEPETLAEHADEVAAAERTLEVLQRRVGALDPPPQATALQAELLQLLELQVAFAREVTQLARYLPVFAAEQQKLATATERLRRELRTETAEEQRAAFARYAETLERVARRLEGMSAPPVLEPSRTREAARVARLAGLARRVGRTLAGGRATELEPLLRTFATAAGDTGVTRAERQAVVEYDRRLRAIGEQRTAVDEERARLERELR